MLVGVGKTHLAIALGHAVIRRRLSVLYSRFDKLFTRLRAARLDKAKSPSPPPHGVAFGKARDYRPQAGRSAGLNRVQPTLSTSVQRCP